MTIQVGDYIPGLGRVVWIRGLVFATDRYARIEVRREA